MDAPIMAPVFAPISAPTAAPRTLPVAAAPRTAPVAAPQPAPWPVAVSQEVSAKELNSSPATISRFFFFIMWSCRWFERRSDGRSVPRIQANAEKLRGDPATLLEPSQPIFLFENSEAVRFHAPQ